MVAVANLLLSEKYLAFLRHDAPVEFLEGTTAAGKTTVGIFKFMLKVAESPKKLHILSGLDLGTIEKNIINKELGILDDFGDLVDYWPGGRGEYSLPHLVFRTSNGTKIIFVLGYDNKKRWKKALGGQYGCLYIDEINIADMEYVRESAMRCDYLMGTLNPDDPALPIYREYINHSRPLPEWAADTPKEIMNQLNQTPKPGWVAESFMSIIFQCCHTLNPSLLCAPNPPSRFSIAGTHSKRGPGLLLSLSVAFSILLIIPYQTRISTQKILNFPFRRTS